MKTGEEAVERAELKSLKAVSIAGLFLVAVIWGSTFTANKIVLETLSRAVFCNVLHNAFKAI